MVRNFFVTMYRRSLESWAGMMWATKLNGVCYLAGPKKGNETQQTDMYKYSMRTNSTCIANIF